MTTKPFEVVSPFEPRGDQPQAIDALTAGINQGRRFQTLMGATGTGKTFSMAHTIARVNRPTLVISHNKTLAAQLYEEFKDLLPNNAVHYFVSYYDYYQPEAYIPQRDIYIEKDSSRNDNLDRLRLAATSALVSRRDVVVVASVSCIFGLGSPDQYRKSVISLHRGQLIDRQDLLRALSDMQYTRAEMEFKRGNFRVRGDIVEIHPAAEEFAYRVEFFGDAIDAIQYINPLTGELLADQEQLFIYPAVHYVVPPQQIASAVASITEEMDKRAMHLRMEGKLLEAQRLIARTKYDLEMLQEVGYCNGVENYSRHLDGRLPGEKPYTLMDYFPDATSGEYHGGYNDGSRTDLPAPTGSNEGGARDWMLMIDESHVTLPQMRAMYFGDRRRKETLVEHGFRLPSAMDNRPLRFEEIEQIWPQVVFVSATPGPYELEKSQGEVVEQVIRPTGLVDPIIEVRPAQGQVPDMMQLARERTAMGERTIVTTLTKRLSEDLAAYLAKNDIKCRYLHSEIETLDRLEILRDLRRGEYDVLIGVNLLREGLDLPEVSLVGIMDADKTGFLRSATSLIQQIGRAARNVNARVILYADTVTPAMKQAIDETNRRREKQLAYNEEHGITPQTVKKAIRDNIEKEIEALQTVREALEAEPEEFDRTEILSSLKEQMLTAAESLNFEKAALLRDRIKQYEAAPDMTGGKKLKKQVIHRDAPGTPGTRPRKSKSKKKS